MRAAAHEQNVPLKDMQTLLRAVLQEHGTHGIWPKDF